MVFDLFFVAKNYVKAADFVSKSQIERPFEQTEADTKILEDTTHFRVFEMDGNMNSARASFFHKSIEIKFFSHVKIKQCSPYEKIIAESGSVIFCPVQVVFRKEVVGCIEHPEVETLLAQPPVFLQGFDLFLYGFQSFSGCLFIGYGRFDGLPKAVFLLLKLQLGVFLRNSGVFIGIPDLITIENGYIQI